MRLILPVALLGVLALNGCGGPAPTPTPTAAPGEPVFASEEEALAAAEAVFVEYVAASQLMGGSGGRDLTGFDGLVSADQLADEQQQADQLIEHGIHLQGSIAYSNFRLQQLDQTNPPLVFIQVYLCVDLTGVSYVDAEGNDTGVADHDDAAPVEAVFVNDLVEPRRLIIEDVRSWTGENFC